MTFPNAYSGVKKIFIGEILQIVGEILTGAGGVIAVGGAAAQSAGGLIGGGAVAIIGMILLLVALIMNLIGLHAAGKDEKRFIKVAFTMAIIALILSLVGGFVPFVSVVSSFLKLLVFWFTIFGILELAQQLNDNGVYDFGKKVVYIILITLIISIVLGFLPISAASAVIGIIAMVLEIIGLICYLVFLSMAKHMLGSK